MYRNDKFSYRLVACGLLLSLCLQGCSNSTIYSADGENRDQAYNKQASIQREQAKDVELFSPQQEHQITIHQQGLEEANNISGKGLLEPVEKDFVYAEEASQELNYFSSTKSRLYSSPIEQSQEKSTCDSEECYKSYGEVQSNLPMVGNDPVNTDQQIAMMLRRTIERFVQQDELISAGFLVPFCKILTDTIQGRPINFYGIKEHEQHSINFMQLKREIAQKMGTKTLKLVQIIGDSSPFSEEGTSISRKFLTPYFEGDHILEYGFTGYLTDNREKLDVNSFLNEYVEDNPDQAHRVLANIVGHSIHALEKWGCKVSPKISHYVVVYNKNGMNEGFTKFGDDVITSDYIQSVDDGDMIIMLEGGPQSFKQAVNVLQNNVPIKALFNIRSSDRRAFFSTTEFFHLVKQKLLIDPELSPESVKVILDTYLKTHEAWDPKRPDSDTKEALFYSTADKFINERIYKKLLDKVEISDALQLKQEGEHAKIICMF